MQADLLQVYGQFASEYGYRPVDVADVPYGPFAVEFGASTNRRILHNYGAMQSLERLLGLVQEGGFILVNDYGSTEVTAADEYEHQRFSRPLPSGSTFRSSKRTSETASAVSGNNRNKGIRASTRACLARGSGRKPCSASTSFSKAAYDGRNEPLLRAREWAKVGRFEAALASYREALQRQPLNWVLMNEVALHLTHSLRNPHAGVDMAKVCLT